MSELVGREQADERVRYIFDSVGRAPLSARSHFVHFRIVGCLLVCSVFFLAGNGKFIWEFFGSAMQVLAIDSLKLCVCRDSSGDAQELNQDLNLAAAVILVVPPEELPGPPPAPPLEAAVSAPGQPAPPDWWHRPPPHL